MPHFYLRRQKWLNYKNGITISSFSSPVFFYHPLSVIYYVYFSSQSKSPPLAESGPNRLPLVWNERKLFGNRIRWAAKQFWCILSWKRRVSRWASPHVHLNCYHLRIHSLSSMPNRNETPEWVVFDSSKIRLSRKYLSLTNETSRSRVWEQWNVLYRLGLVT